MTSPLAESSLAVSQTIDRYQSREYATRYKQEYTQGFRPVSLRSRVIAARELSVMGRMLSQIPDLGVSVLDIPCGTGKLGSLLAKFPVRVTAADVSAEMLRLARPEYRSDQIHELREMDVRTLPLERQSIDTVICLRLFQRLPREARVEALGEFSRVARRHLVISYSLTSPVQRLRRRVRGIYDSSMPKLFHVTWDDIRNELTSAGFDILATKHVLRGLSSEVVVHAATRS